MIAARPLSSLIRCFPMSGLCRLPYHHTKNQFFIKFTARCSAQAHSSTSNLLPKEPSSSVYSSINGYSSLYNTLVYNENYDDRYLSDEELKSDSNFQRNDPFICLSELIKFNRPRTAYSILRYYTNENMIGQKSIYPAAKLLASVRFHGVECEDFLRIVEYIRAKLPNGGSDVFNSVRYTIYFLLDACQEKFDTLTNEEMKNPNVKQLLDTSDCFHLAGGIAFNSANWDVLEKLCMTVACRETFFSHNVFPIYDKFIRLLTTSQDSVTIDRVVRIFMDHLVSSEYYMTNVEFDEFVEPALKLSKQWRWKEIRPITSRSACRQLQVHCEECSATLKNQNTLTAAEHTTLLQHFENSLQEGLRTEQVASVREFALLRNLLTKIRHEHNHSKSIPLVIDGLNALHASTSDSAFGRTSVVRPLSFTGLYNLVLKLLNRRYGPILVIHRRHTKASEFVQKLRIINVYSFQCDKRSEDDTFMIYAALVLGWQTQILTNDLFQDWRSMLAADGQKLFDRWYSSRRIAYHNGQYEIPTAYKRCVQQSKSGYHASVMGLISRNHWIKPRTFCIRKLENV